MMKFNVEDKVRIKKDIPVGSELRYIDFLEGMKEDADNEVVFTIKEADKKDNAYSIKEINDIDNGWWICEEWIELVRNDDKILFAKVKPDAIIPTKREADGCYDVYANFDEEMFVIQPHKVRLVPTGIASAFDKKYRIGIRERGSNTKGTLIVMAGQIDSNFRGEWFVALYNGNDVPVAISKEVTDVVKTEDYIQVPYTKAIAQFAVEIVPEVEVKEVTFDDIKAIESDRGFGMLGSSNK